MTELELDLYVCVTGLALWIFVIAFYGVRIGRRKRSLAAGGAQVPGNKSSYYLSLVLSLVLSLLPFLILLRLYATAVIEGCAVLGALLVLRERLRTLDALL